MFPKHAQFSFESGRILKTATDGPYQSLMGSDNSKISEEESTQSESVYAAEITGDNTVDNDPEDDPDSSEDKDKDDEDQHFEESRHIEPTVLPVIPRIVVAGPPSTVDSAADRSAEAAKPNRARQHFSSTISDDRSRGSDFENKARILTAVKRPSKQMNEQIETVPLQKAATQDTIVPIAIGPQAYAPMNSFNDPRPVQQPGASFHPLQEHQMQLMPQESQEEKRLMMQRKMQATHIKQENERILTQTRVVEAKEKSEREVHVLRPAYSQKDIGISQTQATTSADQMSRNNFQNAAAAHQYEVSEASVNSSRDCSRHPGRVCDKP